jgi:cell division initiation protein
MGITPVEIRRLPLKRGLLGFKRSSVEHAMDDIAESFEGVWRERAELADRVEALEVELNRHVELETLLRSTLVSAERAAQDMKEQARREADVILTEANAEARKVMRDSLADREALATDAQRIRSLLRSALGVLDDIPVPAVEEESDAPASSDTSTRATPVAVVASEEGAAEVDPAIRRLAG